MVNNVLMKKYSIVKHMFLKEDRAKVLALFFGMLVLSFTEMVGVASIVPFMGMVTDNSVITTNEYLNFVYVTFGFTSTDDFLFFSGVAVLCLIAISNSFSIFMQWNMQKFVFMQEHRIAVRMLRKYLTQEYMFFLGRNSSELSKNILSEIGRAMSGVILPILQVVSKSVTTLMLVGLLIFTDPTLAASIFLTLGTIYISLFAAVRRVLHSIGNVVADAISLRYKILSETFSSIKILKLKGGEAQFTEWFSVPALKYAKYSAVSTVISHAPRYLLEIVAFGGIMAIVLYLISQGQSNSYVISYMALYAFAGYRLLPALQQIYASLTLVHYNLPAVEAIISDLRLNEVVTKVNNVRNNAETFKTCIELNQIKFKYPDAEEWLLKDINISIRRNSTVAIVGETGAGKSTLVDIILSLHIPSEGRILLDDCELTEDNMSDWKRSIGYVPQDIYLADDTLQNNIAFMVLEEDISMSDVIAAAKIAHIHDFIMQLPEQYKTRIGERGVRLSGGQKQRLGIARALYDNPDILVLDEATSAMDTLTESSVMKAIRSLGGEKTIIMIAHRLTTIRDCDVIYLLDEGMIAGYGDFEELSRSNKKFQRMSDA
jgi:ATP-binding cassette, subfamily B, bacterial PglK